MEFGKRHDTTDTTDFGPRQLVTDLLRVCYGETGVMDFGLMAADITSCKAEQCAGDDDQRHERRQLLTTAEVT